MDGMKAKHDLQTSRSQNFPTRSSALRKKSVEEELAHVQEIVEMKANTNLKAHGVVSSRFGLAFPQSVEENQSHVQEPNRWDGSEHESQNPQCPCFNTLTSSASNKVSGRGNFRVNEEIYEMKANTNLNSHYVREDISMRSTLYRFGRSARRSIEENQIRHSKTHEMKSKHDLQNPRPSNIPIRNRSYDKVLTRIQSILKDRWNERKHGSQNPRCRDFSIRSSAFTRCWKRKKCIHLKCKRK